ncbi:MAG: alpha/beta hydrolase [Opitutales bacterium]
MKIGFTSFFFLCAALFFPGVSMSIADAAEEPVVMRLWTGEAPGASGEEERDIPRLMAYLPLPEKANGTAVVVCPGGGYGNLAMDHEGRQIGEWLSSIGVTAFVLQYRLPADGYRHPIPLMDAQRAIRLVRARAGEWGIDADRVGILGFSAGGHLASTVATHFENPVSTGEHRDEVDDVASRPDFQILIYPVISMSDGITHWGSRNNLLGSEASQEDVTLLSSELQVTGETPPAFLVHADDDAAVVPENSIRYYLALREARVPAEMHIYRNGGHGFGIRPSAGPAAGWADACRRWMERIH